VYQSDTDSAVTLFNRYLIVIYLCVKRACVLKFTSCYLNSTSFGNAFYVVRYSDVIFTFFSAVAKLLDDSCIAMPARQNIGMAVTFIIAWLLDCIEKVWNCIVWRSV